MVSGFSNALNGLIESRPLRLTLSAGVLGFALLVATLFPPTPDELSRIEVVQKLWAGERYAFFWPPGNIIVILINPLMATPLDPVIAVRLFNTLLGGLPLAVLVYRTRDPLALFLAGLTLPYACLVLSTGSQQGLMIGLLCCLAWAAATPRPAAFVIAATALYLVNPSMILILPSALALAVLIRQGAPFPRLLGFSCLAYLPVLILVGLAYAYSGQIMPTLSINGALNLFLGNNPDPMAARGVGDLASINYGLTDPSPLEAVVAFATQDPGQFLANLATKAALYWAPWDFLRSGMGQGVSTVIFSYIAIAQIAIYACFFTRMSALDRHRVVLALSIAIAAWALYTMFFVKIRFRVPFDILFVITILLGPPRTRTVKP